MESFAKFLGRSNGTSKPISKPIFFISTSSVDKITLVSFLLFSAASAVYARSGYPDKILIFFLSIPLEPPLANIRPKKFCFFFNM